MASLMNGLAAMGTGIAAYASAAGLESQRADAATQQMILGNDLATTRESAGRQEAGAIAATAADKQQTFLSGLEDQKGALARQALQLADQLQGTREMAGRSQAAGIASSALEQSDRLLGARESAGRQEAAALAAEAPTPEIKSARQFARLSPEEKQAFREEAMTKAGLPPWLIGGNDSPPPPTGTRASAAPGDAAAPGAPVPVSGAPAAGGAISNRNTKALEGLPEGATSIITGMVDGRIAPPSSMALAKPYWQGMVAKAAEFDPTFDQTTWAGRVATRKSFTAGQDATAITALNTALGHAEKLWDQFGELNNFGSVATPLNWVVNPVERVFGDSRQTKAQQTIDALASEARKVFAASGAGNLTELLEWQKGFPLNGSQSQQKASLTNFVELLDSRLQALAEKYNRGMGRTDDPMTLLQPNARKAYIKLTGAEPENAVGKQMGTPPASAPASAPASTAPGPSADPLAAARDAISRGAPRDAVMKRLQDAGIDLGAL